MACFLYPGEIVEAENPRPELMMAKVSKERERKRNRQTDRQRDREAERQRDREAKRQRETECNEYIS